MRRIAIIGAGPSGFYAADSLFKSGQPFQVDMFDRLPTPFGLLRGGVAPDHQKMKSVGSYYDRIATTNPTFSFFGNVHVGKDISVDELKQYYDALIFSYGAETDKHLGIPGESLPGSYTATEFVGWYNGHPDYQDRQFDLSHDSVAIIGQGNVAIDVTRILAKTPHELSTSDMTQAAMDALSKSNIKNIYLIGRRGPAQSAFTELEIKELGNLDDCDIRVRPEDMNIDVPTESKAARNYAILKGFSEKAPKPASKIIHVRFYLSPLEFQPGAITFEINQLDAEQRAVGTGKKETLPCGLMFRSIGYKGIAMPGLPFDEKKGVVPNTDGRVAPGIYVCGWIKRGANGVLGSNKPDGKQTVDCLLADLPQLSRPSAENIRTLLESRSIQAISYADWQKVDVEEVRRGQGKGKPREKFTSTSEILSFLSKTLAV